MRTSIHRTLAGCIGAAFLATGVTAVAGADPSGGAEATGPIIVGTCGDTFAPTIDGAEARWTLHCDKPPLINRLTGYVKDTRMDGYGAILKFMDSDGRVFFMPQARGWGEVNKFDIDVGQAQIDGELSIGW